MENNFKSPTRYEVLIDLIGKQNTTALYTASPRALFCVKESAQRCTNVRYRRAHQKLVAARELVKRCIRE